MLKITGSEDFYPTPETLLWKITSGIDWTLIESILEPSAGRGNIADFVRQKKESRLQAWENFRGHWCVSNAYEVRSKLSDIEKALDYLDNGETQDVNLDIMEDALRKEITADIQLKYFRVTFYKKGTCHITFTNERLLKKLNIFGSQRKGWLPKGYARRKYEEMDAEEQAVINSFEGREAYNASLMESEYYLFDAGNSLPMLGA